MSDFQVIEGYVEGDDLDIGPKAVANVDPTDPLVKAWLTVKAKATDADPGALQKVITTASLPGTGQITANGDATHGNGVAQVLFQLTGVDTLTLGAKTRFVFDVQVKTAAGKIYTALEGYLQLDPGVTATAS